MNAHLIAFLSKITMLSFTALLFTQTLVSWYLYSKCVIGTTVGIHHGAESFKSDLKLSYSFFNQSHLPSNLSHFHTVNEQTFIPFQSSPPMPLNCPYSASFFLYRVWGEASLCHPVPFSSTLIAQLGHQFIYHFNNTLISLPRFILFPVIVSILPTLWVAIWSQLNLVLNSASFHLIVPLKINEITFTQKWYLLRRYYSRNEKKFKVVQSEAGGMAHVSLPPHLKLILKIGGCYEDEMRWLTVQQTLSDGHGSGLGLTTLLIDEKLLTGDRMSLNWSSIPSSYHFSSISKLINRNIYTHCLHILPTP